MRYEIGDYFGQHARHHKLHIGILDGLPARIGLTCSVDRWMHRDRPRKRVPCDARVFIGPRSPSQSIRVIWCSRVFVIDVLDVMDDGDLDLLFDARDWVPKRIGCSVSTHGFLKAGVCGVIKTIIRNRGVWSSQSEPTETNISGELYSAYTAIYTCRIIANISCRTSCRAITGERRYFGHSLFKWHMAISVTTSYRISSYLTRSLRTSSRNIVRICFLVISLGFNQILRKRVINRRRAQRAGLVLNEGN